LVAASLDEASLAVEVAREAAALALGILVLGRLACGDMLLPVAVLALSGALAVLELAQHAVGAVSRARERLELAGDAVDA
jgi:hypothetical protein